MGDSELIRFLFANDAADDDRPQGQTSAHQ
jgi:hypothetical protein